MTKLKLVRAKCAAVPDVPLDRTRAAASNGGPVLPSYLGDRGIKISG
jgi:hypothetical protein